MLFFSTLIVFQMANATIEFRVFFENIEFFYGSLFGSLLAHQVKLLFFFFLAFASLLPLRLWTMFSLSECELDIFLSKVRSFQNPPTVCMVSQLLCSYQCRLFPGERRGSRLLLNQEAAGHFLEKMSSVI